MIQLGGFYIFSFVLNPYKVINASIFHGLSKVWYLADKVSDDKCNKIVDAANIFRKMSKDELNKTLRSSGIMLTNNEMKDESD